MKVSPQIQIFKSIHDISRADWTQLAPADFPFFSYEFLSSLEDTGCLGTRTGWHPQIVTLWNEDKLWGAIVSYLKDNSYGEYIFDFQWAQAFEQHGLAYYPKIVSAVPFTPATGPKIIWLPTAPSASRSVLMKALLKCANESNISSVHGLFITEGEEGLWTNSGFFSRHSFQYHWTNEGYENFESFLERLRSKRRKEIRRERQQVALSNIKIQRLTGDQLTNDHALLMFAFYRDTIQKMGGHSYLTSDFFQRVFSEMKDQILFVLATTPAGDAVAGALNFFGTETLFGRYWGCLDNYKALHFELCYYQGIEFAIERKFKLFEAGAQGEHKFQRGFLPRLTRSVHWLRDPMMSTAIENFCQREKTQIQDLFQVYSEQTPFIRQEATSCD